MGSNLGDRSFALPPVPAAPDAAVGGLGSPRRRAIRKRDPGQTIVYLNGTAVPDPFKRTLNCGGAHTPLCIV